MTLTLNLDPAFTPIGCTSIEYNMFKYSGGEEHIKLSGSINYSEIEKVIITQRIKNGDDIMKILIGKDALMQEGVKNFELVIPYVPYARQDRVCVPGESFTLKVFAGLINNEKFNKIYVLDAHSKVSTGLLDFCVDLSSKDYVYQSANQIMTPFGDEISKSVEIARSYKDTPEYIEKYMKSLLLISPDAGSNKKISEIYSPSYFSDIIECSKKRNLDTGEITGVKVYADDLDKLRCLVVDDICDGGRTFIELGQKLKEKNAGDIYLYVTHGIFSRGFDELKKYYTHIFCTNSFNDVAENDFVTQFKMKM